MNIQGKLVFDPVITALGKNRDRIFRRHAHLLAAYTRPARHLLAGPELRRANALDRLAAEDPFIWTVRKKNAADTTKLNKLVAHARQVVQSSNYKERYPQLQRALQHQLDRLEQDLILTRQDPGWAILRVDEQIAKQYIKSLRAQGVKINSSAWGPHISVVRGEVPAWKTTQKYNLGGALYSVEVRPELRKNRKGYYWLDVISHGLEELRRSLGLPARPTPGFHLTIGKTC